MCDDIHEVFFKNSKSKDMSFIKPEVLGASSLPLDSKIDYIVFNDPNLLNGVAYCYFVFKGWIQSAKISPDQLGMSATGFSILNEDLGAYQKWLATSNEAARCKGSVMQESEVTVSDLSSYLKDRTAIIGLNPYASIQTPNSNLQSVLKDLTLTLNHERIHAFQASCASFDKWSLDEWKKLPFKEKNEYIKKYTTYTWSIPKVAGREYIGYKYEDNFEALRAQISSCPQK